MVKWDYLEAFVMKSPGMYPMKVVIPKEYADAHNLTGPFYSLKELGELGWNLAFVFDNVEDNEIRVVFKRPNA